MGEKAPVAAPMRAGEEDNFGLVAGDAGVSGGASNPLRMAVVGFVLLGLL